MVLLVESEKENYRQLLVCSISVTPS